MVIFYYWKEDCLMQYLIGFKMAVEYGFERSIFNILLALQTFLVLLFILLPPVFNQKYWPVKFAHVQSLHRLHLGFGSIVNSAVSKYKVDVCPFLFLYSIFGRWNCAARSYKHPSAPTPLWKSSIKDVNWKCFKISSNPDLRNVDITYVLLWIVIRHWTIQPLVLR